MSALCHTSVKLTSIFPIAYDGEVLLRSIVKQVSTENDSTLVHRFPLLVAHMEKLSQNEENISGMTSFREVLEKMLVIVVLPVRNSLRREHELFSSHLVSNTCGLLASIVSELTSSALGSEIDGLNSLHSVKASANRFTKTSQGRSWNTGNGSPDAICFSVDKPGIVVVGFSVYGGGGIHEYELEVLVDDENVKYAVRLRNYGSRTANGDGGMTTVQCPDGVTFTFSTCSLSSNGTNQTRGQIPQILYYRSEFDGDLQSQLLSKANEEDKNCSRALSVVSTVVRAAKDLLHRALAVDADDIPELLSSSSLFSMLLPLIIAYIGPVAAAIPKVAVEVFGLVQQLLPSVAILNQKYAPPAFNPNQSTDSTTGNQPEQGLSACTTSNHYAVIESEHPYKPACVMHYKVTFPECVRWMTIEFDPQCGTAQSEDVLRLLIPVRTVQNSGYGPKLTSVHENLNSWIELKKFSGSSGWPTMVLVLPGSHSVGKRTSQSWWGLCSSFDEKGSSTSYWWLQPDSYADPQKTSLILNKDDIRCGWPTTITVQTKDQYGDVVHVPNMKVEVKAVPVSQKKTSLQQEQVKKAQRIPGSPAVTAPSSNTDMTFGGLASPKLDVSYEPMIVKEARYIAITMMKVYENYSFEELRFASPTPKRPSENMLIRVNNDGTYCANWTPGAIGLYTIHVTIDGIEIDAGLEVKVKDPPKGMIPPGTQLVKPKTEPQPNKVRKFVAKDSAGLRIRSHPSLQSEQIGIVKVNGTITFIDEIHNDDGVWLRLNDETIKKYVPNMNGYTEAWCLSFNQHLGKSLLVPVDEPKTNTDDFFKDINSCCPQEATMQEQDMPFLRGGPGMYKVVKTGPSGHNIRSCPNLRGDQLSAILNSIQSRPNLPAPSIFDQAAKPPSSLVHSPFVFGQPLSFQQPQLQSDRGTISTPSRPVCTSGKSELSSKHSRTLKPDGRMSRTTADQKKPRGTEGLSASESLMLKSDAAKLRSSPSGASSPRSSSPHEKNLPQKSTAPVKTKLDPPRERSKSDSYTLDPDTLRKKKMPLTEPLRGRSTSPKPKPVPKDSKESSGSENRAPSPHVVQENLHSEVVEVCTSSTLKTNSLTDSTCDESSEFKSVDEGSNKVHFSIGKAPLKDEQEMRASPKISRKCANRHTRPKKEKSSFLFKGDGAKPLEPAKQAMSPSVAECARAVFASFLWHEGIVHDAMACSSFLKFNPELSKEHAPIRSSLNSQQPTEEKETKLKNRHSLEISSALNMFNISPHGPDISKMGSINKNKVKQSRRKPLQVKTPRALPTMEAHQVIKANALFLLSLSSAAEPSILCYHPTKPFQSQLPSVKEGISEDLPVKMPCLYLQTLARHHHENFVGYQDDNLFQDEMRYLRSTSVPAPYISVTPDASPNVFEEPESNMKSMPPSLETSPITDTDLAKRTVFQRSYSVVASEYDKQHSILPARVKAIPRRRVNSGDTGERNFQWPVLAFVIQHHDLEGLEIAMKQALRKSACRVFAMEELCIVMCLKDLTSIVDIKTSSRPAMIGSLTDGSTETFWESGDEDKNKTKNITINCVKGINARYVSVHVDNSRDLGVDLDSRHIGWVTSELPGGDNHIIKIELKGPENTLRVRQVKVLGWKDGESTKIAGQISASVAQQRNCEAETLRVFRLITSQAIRMEATRVREEWEHAISSKENANSQPSDEDASSDAYCFELLSMVLALSGSNVGRQYLAQQLTLLQDLFSLLHTASPRVQRQVTSLLRRVLPEVTPNRLASIIGVKSLPPADISDIIHSTEKGDWNKLGILDMFLGCIAKALTVQLKAKGTTITGTAGTSVGKGVTTVTLPMIFNSSYIRRGESHWWMKGSTPTQISEIIIKLIKDMAAGHLSEAWSRVTKNAIAETIIALTKMEEEFRSPVRCIATTRVFKEEEEAIKVDLHEGCGRTKLFWLMALADSKTMKAMVEFREHTGKPTTSSSEACRFCGSRSGTELSAVGSVCSDADCQEYAKIACSKTHPCGHPCGGVKNEEHCLPCLHGCDKSATALKQDADDMCMICFTEALSAAPAIQNKINHIVLKDLLDPIKELYEDVRRKALMRLEYEGLHKSEAITTPGVRFYNDPAGYAMNRYAYYVCYKCRKAYFGGEARCDAEAGQGDDYDPRELICGACSDVSRAQMCPKHGTDFLEYKCRYCCSVAVFFCFGTTHFCNACHDDFQRMTSIPKEELPHCPAVRSVIDLSTQKTGNQKEAVIMPTHFHGAPSKTDPSPGVIHHPCVTWQSDARLVAAMEKKPPPNPVPRYRTRMKRGIGRDSDHNSSGEDTAEKSKKLRTASEHSQTCDWGNLLQDIVLQVFKYLPLLDRAHASQVCRNWNQIDDTPVDDPSLKVLVANNSDTLKLLKMSSCPHVSPAGILCVADQCHGLRELALNYHLLSDELLLALSSEKHVRLEHLRIDVVSENPGQTHFHTIQKSSWDAFIRHSPKVNLVMYFFLYEEEFDPFFRYEIPATHLYFGRSVSKDVLGRVGMTCPRLVELVVCANGLRPLDEELIRIAERCKNLSAIGLGECEVSCSAFVEFVKMCGGRLSQLSIMEEVLVPDQKYSLEQIHWEVSKHLGRVWFPDMMPTW
ncbi:hypothetical protein CB1_000626007 [Camelus ferus]|nr:hypothetical protein CB1_000626007 [Camelus ferus]